MYREISGLIVLLGFANALFFFGMVPERIELGGRDVQRFDALFLPPFAGAALYVGLAGRMQDEDGFKKLALFNAFMVGLGAAPAGFGAGMVGERVAALALSPLAFLTGEVTEGLGGKAWKLSAPLLLSGVIFPELLLPAVAATAVAVPYFSFRDFRERA